MEPATGFEPATSPLPRKCSTPELRGHRQLSLNSIRLFVKCKAKQIKKQLQFAAVSNTQVTHSNKKHKKQL